MMSPKETVKGTWISRMQAEFPHSVELNASLKSWTTFHCSASADLLFQPNDERELLEGLSFLKKEDLSWRMIGRGSNLLIRDAGVREVLIALGKGFSEYEIVEEEGGASFLRVGGATSNGTLMSYCRKEGLRGFGFAYGIPGTIGGGIRMNAGTPLGSFSQIAKLVRVVGERGKIVQIPVGEIDFAYRDFPMGHSWIVLSALLKLYRADPSAVDTEIASAKLRRANQPLQLPNFGSVFKNPPGDFAARLIEASGLKGYCEGDAQISEMHANFIVNCGNAKSKDVLALMDLAKSSVGEKFGIDLEQEVHVIGEDR